jgi:hypothetical protein
VHYHYNQHNQSIPHNARQQTGVSDELEVSDLQFELDQLDYDRCPDTGIWLLKNQAFMDFVECTCSASFHLCGNPGSGKTFLSSKIIDELREYTIGTATNTVIYFLCDGKTDVSNRRTSLAILKALTAQLLEMITALDPLFVRTNLEVLRMVNRKAKDIPEGQLFKVLQKCLRYFEMCYLVIDAVDECDDWRNPPARYESLHIEVLPVISERNGYSLRYLSSSDIECLPGRRHSASSQVRHRTICRVEDQNIRCPQPGIAGGSKRISGLWM